MIDNQYPKNELETFLNALNGSRGDLDSWLEVNDEKEVISAICATIEAARREGEDRVIDKLLAAQANENAARSMCEDLRRQLAEAQAHKFFCLTELRRVEELMLSECGLSVVDKQIFDLTESQALYSVIKSEREACAGLVRSWNTAMTDKLADAIRARKNKEATEN